MSDLQYHPLANIFPLMDGAEFDALVADIKVNGLHQSIVLFEGMILDGRNRYQACRAAGVDARFEPYDGVDPVGYVISLNLKRRHLNESQRAMVAARLANMPPHRPDSKSANLQTSQTDAAEMLNVSPRSVASAAVVRDQAVPELQKAVDRGEIAVSVAAALAKLPPEHQAEAAAKPKAAPSMAKKVARAERERELGDKQKALPDKKFGVILADPEWPHEPWSRLTGMDRAADNHYPTSPIEVIAARDVASIADKNCVLFLWATMPQLDGALHVMARWGFEYKSFMVWDKMTDEETDHVKGGGTGYWSRCQHEALLIGTIGSPPCPAPGEQWPSIIRERKTIHSAKPEKSYRMIEQYYPTMPKIELNRRGPSRPGWEAWGNEAEIEEAIEPKQDGDSELDVTIDTKSSALIPALPPVSHTSIVPDIDVPDFLRRARP